MEALIAARAKAIAQAQAERLAAQAKLMAIAQAQQLANIARKRATNGVTSLVAQHMGNNAQSRALASAIKQHINAAHASLMQ